MKKVLISALICAFMMTPVMADEGVTVHSNGNLVADKGIIVEGRTLVPVRGVFEFMGYTVDWDDSTKTATLKNDKKNTTIVIKNGEKDFTVNGKAFTPEVPAQIINGRFMLPLRAVGEAIDAKVRWYGDKKSAWIDENNNFITVTPVDPDDPILQDAPVNEIVID